MTNNVQYPTYQTALPSDSRYLISNGEYRVNAGIDNFLYGNLDYERQVALQQRDFDFQRFMSDTSYQRGVDDMQKAGLNPYLAYSQSGASVGAGSSVNAGRSSTGIGNLVSSLFNLVGIAMKGQNSAYQTALKMEHQEDMLHERLAHQSALQTAKNTYTIDKEYLDKKGQIYKSVSTWKRP